MVAAPCWGCTTLSPTANFDFFAMCPGVVDSWEDGRSLPATPPQSRSNSVQIGVPRLGRQLETVEEGPELSRPGGSDPLHLLEFSQTGVEEPVEAPEV